MKFLLLLCAVSGSFFSLQMISRMVSYLARFSAFIVLVGASFALAFNALFHTCVYPENSSEGLEERGPFESFGSSLLTVLEAALGNFDFGEFSRMEDNCDLPTWAGNAGIVIMVVYIFIMAILLMNLLIAVLSTAHMEVHGNAGKEFYLARSKLIQASAKAVVCGGLPPPLNLLTVIPGFIIDAVDIAARLGAFLPSSTK